MSRPTYGKKRLLKRRTAGGAKKHVDVFYASGGLGSVRRLRLARSLQEEDLLAKPGREDRPPLRRRRSKKARLPPPGLRRGDRCGPLLPSPKKTGSPDPLTPPISLSAFRDTGSRGRTRGNCPLQRGRAKRNARNSRRVRVRSSCMPLTSARCCGDVVVTSPQRHAFDPTYGGW